MPEPKSKQCLQTFLGFITYLSRFIKNFSQKTSILRDLNKEAVYNFTDEHKKCFAQMKAEISETSLLHYNNNNNNKCI